MKLLLTAAVLASMGIASAQAPRDSARATAKCTRTPLLFADAPEPVYVLNARAVGRDSLEALHRDSVESVEVVCADYVYDTFGIRARRSGIVIFTAPGPRAALQSAMDSVAALQSAFRTRTGAFASSLSELGWSDASGLITIELSVTAAGARWTAAGTHRHLGGRRMPVTVGGPRAARGTE